MNAEPGTISEKLSQLRPCLFGRHQLVTKPPDMATNGVGGSVSLNCSAIGETVPLISWKRAAGAWDEKRMKVDKGTLTISVLRESDSGIYVCEAKGPQFTIEARTFLKVKG